MKDLAKSIVIAILSSQVRRLRRRHRFKVIAVVGSVGKTSTKHTIAAVLSSAVRVRYQMGNYNDIVTVPLVYFGQSLPNLLNPFAWLRLFFRNELQIYGKFPWDVVVLELGTDGPGQIAAFQRFGRVDVAVVTAIAPEHMEFFPNIEFVAQEELSVHKYADNLICNSDLCDAQHLTGIKELITFGLQETANFRLVDVMSEKTGFLFKISYQGEPIVEAEYGALSVVQLYSLTAAVAVAYSLGVGIDDFAAAFSRIEPVSGRLRPLRGIHGSTIIDDTYNASPEAVRAALDALYRFDAPQRIALLGSMNELGDYALSAHEQVGKYCDPKYVDLVVTLGEDANLYLADGAQSGGCRVARANTPKQAADIIKKVMRQGAIVLAKGSQNGVYAEEAVKLLLADPDDVRLLVRQSKEWMARKNKVM